MLRETLRSRNGLDVLRKLCLPFSPYRQRPDITLHGPEAKRTVIETLIPATSSVGAGVALWPLASNFMPEIDSHLSYFSATDRCHAERPANVATTGRRGPGLVWAPPALQSPASAIWTLQHPSARRPRQGDRRSTAEQRPSSCQVHALANFCRCVQTR